MKMRSRSSLATVVCSAVLALAFAPTSRLEAQAIDLDFSNPVGTSNGSSSLGPYFSDLSLDFRNVASVGGTSIDMRATASTWGSISFTGHYADYSSNTGEPNGDLGVYYEATKLGLGGIHYQLDFYVGGSNFTTRANISQLDLMLYDVDGEATQSEMVKAYAADGLTSYQVGNSAASVTASPITGGVLLTGPGRNYDETDVSGAFILTYRNTSSILLDFQADTVRISNGISNPVFSAIDGDLSMLNGDTSGFQAPVAVPEPSGALLLGIAGLLIICRRKRLR